MTEPRRVRVVAVVEDDRDIALSLRHTLQKQNDLRVQTFASGEEFLAALPSCKPECVILDLGLPGIDGLAVCQELRSHPVLGAVPILILTARVEEAEKILGFELGADDYVTKPFSVRELSARVRALLRRSEGQVGDREAVYHVAPGRGVAGQAITLDCAQCRVWRGKEEVALTRKELELLRCLVEAKGAVLSRDSLLQGVWGYDFPGETRTVDVHVTRLRKKLGTWIVETVIGAGYRLSKEAIATTKTGPERRAT